MRTKVVPDFEGQVMAVNRVERLLRKVASAFDDAGVPYAVIGGNAVAAWVATVDEGAVRATKDVAVLLRRSNLADAAGALRRAGLVLHEDHGVTMFLDRRRPNPKTGVHVVFAGERVLPSSGHPAPDVAESVRSAGGFMVLDLPGLLAMKLEAFRRVDQVHVEDMQAVELITDEIVARLPTDLRPRLQEIRGTPPRGPRT